MATRNMRIAMNGVTGRLGQSQHLSNSIMAIRNDGGLRLKDGDTLIPEPVLIGRNPTKLKLLAERHGGLAWSADAAAVLADPEVSIYFDVSATAGRVERARDAIAAGKHIYLEKPIAGTLADAVALAREADEAGLKNGVVQDKVFLPGFHKLQKLIATGALGRILSVRIDFGWWVFDGELYPAQRSSWNYKKIEGGGLVLDMFPHWCYILEGLVAPIESVSCRTITQIPSRIDEAGHRYEVDVEDEVFATLELAGGVLAQLRSSWCSRVKRDEMLTVQIDGTGGSAITTLHDCYVQTLATTPKPVWHIDIRQNTPFDDHWQPMPDVDVYKNSYRVGWDLFLRHVAEGTPFPSPLRAGARGLEFVDACYRSHHERRWVDLGSV